MFMFNEKLQKDCIYLYKAEERKHLQVKTQTKLLNLLLSKKRNTENFAFTQTYSMLCSWFC